MFVLITINNISTGTQSGMGIFLDLGHFKKCFIYNAGKKCPAEKYFGFFLPEKLKNFIFNEMFNPWWLHSGHFFPKFTALFSNFWVRVGKFFPLTTLFTRLFNHSHEKRKDSLEARAVLLIFLLEISEKAVQSIHQNSEKWWLLWGLLNENDFEAVLATFCYYGHGAKAVQK